GADIGGAVYYYSAGGEDSASWPERRGQCWGQRHPWSSQAVGRRMPWARAGRRVTQSGGRGIDAKQLPALAALPVIRISGRAAISTASIVAVRSEIIGQPL
ncbi:hypothetical protein LCGC14_2922900, partial [marine sediment metagenome]